MKNSNASLITNSFISNRASLKGGAIALSCDIDETCSTSISLSNFTNNSASEGGALRYDRIPPSLSNNRFTRNVASYGQNISSFPAFIELADPEAIKSIASGQQITHPIKFYFLDFDREIITNDNSS